MADVLDVGPESLALLEAGEWAPGLGDAERTVLLAEYARVLGLDQEVALGWLGDARAAGGSWAPAPTSRHASPTGGNGRPPLAGASRFVQPGAPRSIASRSIPHTRYAAGVPESREPHAALREARVRRGLTQQEAARLLEMRADFVAAMDRGAWERLPRGRERSMLTRYADLVGADTGHVLSGLPGPARHARLEPSGDPSRAELWIRFSGGVLVVTGLVLAAIGVS